MRRFLPQTVKGRVGAAIAVVLATAAAVTAAILPGSAAAEARSQVRAFDSAPIPQALRDGISQSAVRAGVDPRSILEVAPAGQPATEAAVFVAPGKTGDLVAFATPRMFTEFRPASDLTSAQPVQLSISLQPGAASNETGHVQLEGVGSANIASASVTLTNGSSVPLELVGPNRGFTYFSYTSDDPSTFPVSIQALAPDGSTIYTRDLRADVAAPSTP